MPSPARSRVAGGELRGVVGDPSAAGTPAIQGGREPLADDEDWTAAVAREWADELADARQDIYTLADGDPVDAP